MSDKVKRIVIEVFKDDLTGSFESELKESDAFDELEKAIMDACSDHKIEVDHIDLRTR